MKLVIYRQIEEMLISLMEAINYIINSNNYEIIQQLLKDIQLVISSIELSLIINNESITNTIIFQQINICEDIVNDLTRRNILLEEDLLQDLDNHVKELQLMFYNYVKVNQSSGSENS